MVLMAFQQSTKLAASYELSPTILVSRHWQHELCLVHSSQLSCSLPVFLHPAIGSRNDISVCTDPSTAISQLSAANNDTALQNECIGFR